MNDLTSTGIRFPRDGVTADPTRERFLSKESCAALAARVSSFATGGGTTMVVIDSRWSGNTRWARNQISSSGDVRNHAVHITREIRGARAMAQVNQIDDTSLRAAVKRSERLLRLVNEDHEYDLVQHYVDAFSKPDIWSDVTYALGAESRAEAMRELVKPAEAAGMMAAGYVEVSAHGRAVMDDQGRSMYYPYTQAQYSVTVRDPSGVGSAWAGVDWADWGKIDAKRLSQIAVEKCLNSRNPVRLEPGRYTTILEPQAVCDLWESLIGQAMSRRDNEESLLPFHKGPHFSRLGDRVIDNRVSITTDPTDPLLGFPPFSLEGDVYQPAAWITKGVLTALPYRRDYAVQKLGQNIPYLNSGAFRMTGGATTVEEMIATTTRGVLVTRFSDCDVLDFGSWLMSGYTRDGTWLIEHGKIAKPIKNFRFTESPLFAFNNIEQLGVPQRVFHPEVPVVVPPVKVRDFSFTSLSDAV